MSDLDDVLDKYDHDELYVMVSHDGFIVARETGEINQLGEPEDEWVWSWDPAHDREPFSAMETLFERLGFDVEQM